MKILQISSFYGNPGDYFNWKALNYRIQSKIDPAPQIDHLEIRKSYLNYNGDDKWFFADICRDYFHLYDKIIIGGGAMLEIISEQLHWGHSIDLHFDLLPKDSSHILIFSQGFDKKTKITRDLRDKAVLFYSKCQDYNVKVFLRNDGSLKRLHDTLAINPEDYGLREVVDFGLVNPNAAGCSNNDQINNHVIISLTNQFGPCATLSIDTIAGLLRRTVTHLVDHHHLKVVLAPHLHEDLHIYAETLRRLPARITRSDHVILFGLQHSDRVYEQLRDIYSKCRAVVTNRFHGAALAKQYNRPVLSTCTPDKVKHLLSQIPETSIVEDDISQLENSVDRLLSLSEKTPFERFLIHPNLLYSFHSSEKHLQEFLLDNDRSKCTAADPNL